MTAGTTAVASNQGTAGCAADAGFAIDAGFAADAECAAHAEFDRQVQQLLDKFYPVLAGARTQAHTPGSARRRLPAGPARR